MKKAWSEIHKMVALQLLILIEDVVRGRRLDSILFDFTGVDVAIDWQTVNGIRGTEEV